MFCMACKKELGVCACPDARRKLLTLRKSVPMKWCKACDNHYQACRCATPDFTVMHGEKDLGPIVPTLAGPIDVRVPEPRE